MAKMKAIWNDSLCKLCLWGGSRDVFTSRWLELHSASKTQICGELVWDWWSNTSLAHLKSRLRMANVGTHDFISCQAHGNASTLQNFLLQASKYFSTQLSRKLVASKQMAHEEQPFVIPAQEAFWVTYCGASLSYWSQHFSGMCGCLDGDRYWSCYRPKETRPSPVSEEHQTDQCCLVSLRQVRDSVGQSWEDKWVSSHRPLASDSPGGDSLEHRGSISSWVQGGGQPRKRYQRSPLPS